MKPSRLLLVDAHQDLAWNMLTFGRDYTRSAAETRAMEAGTETPRLNGDTLLGWPDYQQGRVALIFATLFNAPKHKQLGEWDTQCYQNPEEAHQLYRKQLDAYHQLTDDHPDKYRLIQDQAALYHPFTGMGEPALTARERPRRPGPR